MALYDVMRWVSEGTGNDVGVPFGARHLQGGRPIANHGFEVIDKILRTIELGVWPDRAAQMHGVSGASLRSHKARHADFATLIEKAEAKAQQPNSAPTLDRKAQKRLEAEFRQRTADIRKTISTSEKVMEQAQEKLHEIETQLSDTALYEDEAKEQLKHILAEQTTLSQRLEEAEITWCEAQEALEAAEQAFAQELANA